MARKQGRAERCVVLREKFTKLAAQGQTFRRQGRVAPKKLLDRIDVVESNAVKAGCQWVKRVDGWWIYGTGR